MKPHKLSKKKLILLTAILLFLVLFILSAVLLHRRSMPLLAEFERINVEAKANRPGDMLGYQPPGQIVLEETVKEIEEKHSCTLRGKLLINDDICWINRRGDDTLGFETTNGDIVIWTLSMQYQHNLLDELAQKAEAENKPCKAVKTSTGKIVCVVIADDPEEYTELVRKIFFVGGDVPAPDAPPMWETEEETYPYKPTGR